MPTQTSNFFQMGFFGIVPSSQSDRTTQAMQEFKRKFSNAITTTLENKPDFPTSRSLFVFLLQYLVSNEKYRKHDIDNMAKTVLDTLKSNVCNDDGQVILLVAAKRLADNRVDQDFAYIKVEIIRDGATNAVLRDTGVERAINFFSDLQTTNPV